MEELRFALPVYYFDECQFAIDRQASYKNASTFSCGTPRHFTAGVSTNAPCSLTHYHLTRASVIEEPLRKHFKKLLGEPDKISGCNITVLYLIPADRSDNTNGAIKVLLKVPGHPVNQTSHP